MRLVCSFLLLACTVSLPAQALRTVPLKTARARQEYRALALRIAARRLSVDWKEAGLDEVVKHLRRTLEVNLVIDRELEPRKEELVVTMSLRDLPARSVLGLLEDGLGIRFQHRDGLIHVTTPEAALRRAVVLEIHGIASITYAPPDFPAPRQIGIRPGGTGDPGDGVEESEPREGVDPEFVVDLVRKATGERNWEHEGVSLSVLGRTRLVVRHTPEMQRAVRRFLARLRGAF